ncbi:DUF7427 family protein [Nocardia brasiliensis]|uniref:DUF7427 family protein n=1 Tax=Nocardia brasiliensis TaxID=37326 RepID=UPI002456E8B2|nr:hypothetical protein [Nocardia brasiliensis]
MTRSKIQAWHLWAVVGAVVVAAELLAPPGQLLSEGVDRALERRPLLVRIAIELVARHLLNDIPPSIDPFSYLPRLRRS